MTLVGWLVAVVCSAVSVTGEQGRSESDAARPEDGQRQSSKEQHNSRCLRGLY